MEEGLPAPDLQTEIFGPNGQLIARVDFHWKEQQTIGEFTARSSTAGCLSLVSGPRT